MTTESKGKGTAPWGEAPTPLVAAWYIENLGSARIDIPSDPSVTTISELADYWNNSDRTTLTKDDLKAIAKFVAKNLPPRNLQLLPSNIDRRLLQTLPFKERTRNGIRKVGMLEESNRLIDVGQILDIPNLGASSLIDFMCVAEVSIDDIEISDDPNQPTQASPEPNLPPGLITLINAARTAHNITTLQQLFDLDLETLISDLGLQDDLDNVKLETIAGDNTLIQETQSEIDKVLNAANEHQLEALQRNILPHPEPETLKQIATRFGVTEGRTCQVQSALINKLKTATTTTIKTIACALQHKHDWLIDTNNLNNDIDRLFPGKNDTDATARWLLNQQLNLTTRGQDQVDAAGAQLLDGLAAHAQSLACEDGVFLTDALFNSFDNDIAPHLHERALKAAGLSRENNEYSSLSSTKSSQVKAAILAIGRPATKEEISELAGLSPRQARRALQGSQTIGRATADKWALLSTIDDEYEGIAQEIIQRINENGGAVELETLINELTQYDVSEASIRQYAYTEQFAFSKGIVTLRHPDNITYRRLQDVTHGRTTDGHPYWTFTVRQRHIENQSIQGVPIEIAKHLGVEPDGTTRLIRIAYHQQHTVSLTWSLTSTNGVVLGRVGPILSQLGVKQDDQMRLVLKPDQTIGITHHTTETGSTTTSPSSLLDQIKQRRSVA